jgi:hypothetical protein
VAQVVWLWLKLSYDGSNRVHKIKISENTFFMNKTWFYNLKLIFLHMAKLKLKKTNEKKLRKFPSKTFD